MTLCGLLRLSGRNPAIRPTGGTEMKTLMPGVAIAALGAGTWPPMEGAR
jgi:hypothetical protein